MFIFYNKFCTYMCRVNMIFLIACGLHFQSALQGGGGILKLKAIIAQLYCGVYPQLLQRKAYLLDCLKTQKF